MARIHIIVATAELFSSSCMRQTLFFTCFTRSLVKAFEANPIQGKRTLCEVHGMDPYYRGALL